MKFGRRDTQKTIVSQQSTTSEGPEEDVGNPALSAVSSPTEIGSPTDIRSPTDVGDLSFASSPTDLSAGEQPSPAYSYLDPAILQASLVIPTKNESLSSGFPYSDSLHDLRISPSDWSQFTAEVLETAKLTSAEQAAAWSAGFSVGLVTAPFLLVLAPVPAYYTGRSLYRKATVAKMKEDYIQNGALCATLAKWNAELFSLRGYSVHLELPGKVEIVMKKNGKEKEKVCQRFRMVIIKDDPDESLPGNTLTHGQTPSYQHGNGIVELDCGPHSGNTLELPADEKHMAELPTQGESSMSSNPQTLPMNSQNEFIAELDGGGIIPAQSEKGNMG